MRVLLLAVLSLVGCAHPAASASPDAAPAAEEAQEVDREALARFVRGRSDAIRNCYELELKRDSSLKGTVVVRFTITPTGAASEVGIESDTMGDKAAAGCLESLVRGWVFPFKPAEDVAVAYPFVFAPAHGGGQ